MQTALWLCLFWLACPWHCSAQAQQTYLVRQRDDSFIVKIDPRLLLNFRQEFESGLRQRIVLSTAAVRPKQVQQDTEHAHLRTCDITHDLWQQDFGLVVAEGGHKRGRRFRTLLQALHACLSFRIAESWVRQSAEVDSKGRFILVTELLLNPVSKAARRRIKQWINKPSDQVSLRGGTFFGSFVNLFLGKQLAESDFRKTFRSGTLVVRP